MTSKPSSQVFLRVCLSTLSLSACAALLGATQPGSMAPTVVATLPPPPVAGATIPLRESSRPFSTADLQLFPALNTVRTLAFAPDNLLRAGTTAGR